MYVWSFFTNICTGHVFPHVQYWKHQKKNWALACHKDAAYAWFLQDDIFVISRTTRGSKWVDGPAVAAALCTYQCIYQRQHQASSLGLPADGPAFPIPALLMK